MQPQVHHSGPGNHSLTTQNKCVSSSASCPMISATRLRSTSGLNIARLTNELLYALHAHGVQTHGCVTHYNCLMKCQHIHAQGWRCCRHCTHIGRGGGHKWVSQVWIAHHRTESTRSISAQTLAKWMRTCKMQRHAHQHNETSTQTTPRATRQHESSKCTTQLHSRWHYACRAAGPQ
jgi:hypothetical protein